MIHVGIRKSPTNIHKGYNNICFQTKTAQTKNKRSRYEALVAGISYKLGLTRKAFHFLRNIMPKKVTKLLSDNK